MEESGNAFLVSVAASELELWKNFNLSDRKVALDHSCVEMREAKTASIAGRRRLNDITKAFRAKAKEEQIGMMTEILKCYQEEIDQLSKRSKNCEATFFALYKAIYDLPDPAITMDSLVNTVMSGSTNQLEIERLRGELSQYDEEFRQLKNQDITIRRLEDTLAEFKEQNEDKIAEEVGRRMLEVDAQASVRVAEAVEAQRTAEKRQASAMEAMKAAQMSADRAQTQLYEVSSQAERKVSALQSENGLLAEGTQRLSLRLAECERELKNAQQALQNLQQQIATGELVVPRPAHLHGGEAGQTAEEEAKTLQVVVATLREELVTASDAARADKHRLEASVRELTQQLAKERELATKWKQELSVRPSREKFLAVRKQLKMVTKIAFNVQDEDAEAEAPEADPETTHTAEDPTAGPTSGKSSIGRDFAQLEALLAGRMKALETDLASTRSQLAESRRSEAAAKEQVAVLSRSVKTSAQMIARLETDLDARAAALEASVAAVTGVPGKAAAAGALGAAAQPLDLAALLGVQEEGRVVKAGVPGGAALTGNAQINLQMINILQAQRDQYKDKLTRAETLLQKLQVDLESAQLAKQRLETDNLALYSKIKYLQSYGGGGSGGGVAAYRSPQALRIANKPVFFGANQTPERRGRRDANGDVFDDEYRQGDEESREGEDGVDVERRYHQLYEQRMNPFDQFSQREKQRKLQELTVADRIVLNTTMALVSNQTGRNFLLLYLGAMHLFMFCIIYYTAHHAHSGCDPSIDHLSPEDTAALAAKFLSKSPDA